MMFIRRWLIATIACLPLCDGARAAEPERVAAGLQFLEGTIFVGTALYFVDYSTSDVLRLAGNTVERVWHQDGCGANGLALLSGTLFVACFDSGTIAQISLAGATLGTIDKDRAGHPFSAPNDLATDAKGGMYFTASGAAGLLGKVYYRATDGRVTEVAVDIGFANGVAVSPDGKLLYVVETTARRVLRFTIMSDGALGDRRVLVRLGDILREGRQIDYTPDSMRIDKHGNLFVALYNGGGFAVIDPDGSLIRQVDVPGAHHTNLAITPDGAFVTVTAVDDGPGGTYRGELYRLPNPVAQ
jgi:gluconolactonase